MTKWLVSLLAWLPGFVLGKASTEARSIRNQWFRQNGTVEAHRRSWYQALLVRASGHPLLFTVLVAGISVASAKLVTSRVAAKFGIHVPTLKADFDFPAFVGVPWSVQATVVGLVYPIVISFIALMLQRRSHSTAALRLYALDSGVIPAGASSIGLLVALSLEFFGALHATEHKEALIFPLLAFDATWFVVNLALTAYFLARTIRFLQDDEQSLTLKKLAVDVVLRQEIASIVTQKVSARAPDRRWKLPVKPASRSEPSIQMLVWGGDATTQVKQQVNAGEVIEDIHLRLLGWVGRRWLKRAPSHVPKNGQPGPKLHFRGVADDSPAGLKTICSVTAGPDLTRFERAVVRMAYVVRRGRDVALGLSTGEILGELALECQSQAESGQFAKAEAVFLEQLELHKILLAACAFIAEGEPDSAALLQPDGQWLSHRMLQARWLDKYDELARLGVALLDRDSRLFRLVACVPAALTSALPPRPSTVLSSSQDAASVLARQLGLWWIREAQLANLRPGVGLGGNLPAPLDKVYESALTSFIGAWNSVHVGVPQAQASGDATRWKDLVARCLVYADHIDQSAKLFLDAMARGDEAASTRYCDHFLKWWGLHSSELEMNNLEYDPDFDRIELSIAAKTWEEVVDQLSGGRMAFSPLVAERAINLGLRRYWESMRVLVILLCMKNAGGAPAADSREIRMAAALVKGEPLHTGSDVEADDLDDPSVPLNRLVAIGFGDQSTVQRLDAFCDRLRWDGQVPEVPGWPYSWSGTHMSVNSLMPQQAQLLCSLVEHGEIPLAAAKATVERLWRDIDELGRVRDYCEQIRSYLVADLFAKATPLVEALRQRLGRSTAVGLASGFVGLAYGRLADIAARERRLMFRALTVSPDAVRRCALQVAEAAFKQGGSNKPFGGVVFEPSLSSTELTALMYVDKRRLLDPHVGPLREQDLAYESTRLRGHANNWALFTYLSNKACKPVESHGVGSAGGSTPQQGMRFLTSVAEECTALSSKALSPVVLVSPGLQSGALQAYRWIPERGQTAPTGIELRDGKAEAGDLARRYINEVPIFETSTPGGGCFVVPLADISVLAVRGVEAAEAISARWELHSDEQVLVTLAWQSTASQLA